MNNAGKSVLIRTIMSAIAVVIVILSALEIIPEMTGLIVASVILAAASVWNGIESIKEGRTKTGVVNLVAAVLLIVLGTVSVIF